MGLLSCLFGAEIILNIFLIPSKNPKLHHMKSVSLICITFLISLGILQGQTVKKSRTEKFVQIVEGKAINHIDITYGKHATFRLAQA